MTSSTYDCSTTIKDDSSSSSSCVWCGDCIAWLIRMTCNAVLWIRYSSMPCCCYYINQIEPVLEHLIFVAYILLHKYDNYDYKLINIWLLLAVPHNCLTISAGSTYWCTSVRMDLSMTKGEKLSYTRKNPPLLLLVFIRDESLLLMRSKESSMKGFGMQ